MKAEIEVLLLPYDAAQGQSLLHRLISELETGRWRRFRAAVAFARDSANYEELLTALSRFADAGGAVELTFGADVFGDTKGSDFLAIHQLLDAIGHLPSVRLHLYHEPKRTFHPKVYLFDAQDQAEALMVIGSSNWSYGGLVNNVEASVLVHLNLSHDGHREVYDRVTRCFENYWSEQ